MANDLWDLKPRAGPASPGAPWRCGRHLLWAGHGGLGCSGPWRLPHSPWAPEPGHLLLQGLILFLQPGHLVGCKSHCLVKDAARGAGRGVLPALEKSPSLPCPGRP